MSPTHSPAVTDIVCLGYGKVRASSGNGNDRTTGGRGSDLARGGSGRDVCRTEGAALCEIT